MDEDLIKHDLKNLVRSCVEETLNALLDKEADELVNAQKYERSAEHQGYRSGHYKRISQTTDGEVELNVPKLKGVPFETTMSALMLVCAILRHVVGTQWGAKRYMNMDHLHSVNLDIESDDIAG